MRDKIIHPAGDWIGNRVWLDEDANGRQDAWEAGCRRRLRQAVGREEPARSSRRRPRMPNGYYAFDHPDGDVLLQFLSSDAYQFTTQDVGDDDLDSDVNGTGETKIFRGELTQPIWDAGLLLARGQNPPQSLRHQHTLVHPNPGLCGTHSLRPLTSPTRLEGCFLIAVSFMPAPPGISVKCWMRVRSSSCG